MRRLIIEAAHSQKDPMLILPMEQMVLPNRLDPSFHFRTLETMNFETKFIHYIKILFNGPKAQILTNGCYWISSHYPGGFVRAAPAHHCCF